jgi:hypothetical protein
MWLDPVEVLFGLVSVCSAISVAFAFVLHEAKWAVWPLIWTVAVALCASLGIVVLGLMGAVDPAYIPSSLVTYTDVILAHRWLVLQLPVFMLTAVLGVLVVYQDRLLEKHADPYHRSVMVGCVAALFATLVAAAEWSL